MLCLFCLLVYPAINANLEARTNVKAKLMADQGMADAVVPLSDDCLRSEERRVGKECRYGAWMDH